MQRVSRRHAICLCCDAAYFPLALFLACQIDRAAPGRDYDICLCSDSALFLPPAFRDRGFRLVTLDPGEDYGALHNRNLARSTYLRLWLVTALGDDYGHILYIDSDMYLEAGDPGDLFQVDLEGRVLGAIRDMQQWSKPDRHVAEFAALGLPALPYFNAGLMLIDTERFRDENILVRTLDLARDQPEVLYHHDQSLLNGVLRGNFAELSPVWNWQWVGKRGLFSHWADVRLVHFVGHDKPWNDRTGTLAPRYRSHYAAFLGDHFPEAGLLQPTAQPGALHTARFVKTIGQHVLSYAAFRRMIARFPDAGRIAA